MIGISGFFFWGMLPLYLFSFFPVERFNMFSNCRRSSGSLLDKFSCSLATLFPLCGVGCQGFQGCGKRRLIFNDNSSASRYEILCFGRVVAARAEEYRNAVNRRLKGVVHVDAESATDIGYGSQ